MALKQKKKGGCAREESEDGHATKFEQSLKNLWDFLNGKVY